MQKPFNDLELSRYGNLMIKIIFQRFSTRAFSSLECTRHAFSGSFHPQLAVISRNETENQEKWILINHIHVEGERRVSQMRL